MVRIAVCSVSASRSRLKTLGADRMCEEYVERCLPYMACERQVFATEALLLEWAERRSGRTAATLVLLDSVGQMLTSEQFAARVGGWRDGGVQQLVLAIGPADGWSAGARTRADLLLSLGRMTLPHALAQVVLCEQIYRALTILAGHPYHGGH